MAQITVTGIILSATAMGEYDKRVVILTKERGKISAFARGARRPSNCELSAGTNPFAFGQFEVYEGRSSYTLYHVHIQNHFRELSNDPMNAYMGFYFLELVDYFAKEYTDEILTMQLLYQSLKALLNPHLPNRLVRMVFEFRLLKINGELGAYDSFGLEGDSLYAMHHIQMAPIEKLYTFALSQNVLDLLANLAGRCLAKVVDRPMKSLEIIEMVDKLEK